MGIIELLEKVGEKNVRVQNVVECTSNATMKKGGGTQLTILTREISVADIALNKGKIGLIVWIPRVFEINLSTPEDGRDFLTNVGMTIICITAERAVEIAKKEFPNGAIWQVNHRGGNERHRVIVDNL